MSTISSLALALDVKGLEGTLSNPKWHHFVPKMLSKRFKDEDGRLWFFDGERPHKGVEVRNPESILAARHINTIEKKDGTKDLSAEVVFGRIESETKPLLDKIKLALQNGPPITLTQAERETLAKFVYYQFKRPPEAFFDKVKGVSEADIRADVKALYQDKLGRDPTEEEYQEVLSVDAQKRIHKAGHVMATADPGQNVVDLMLQHCGIFFLITPEHCSWVLGSNPVIRDGGRLGMSDARILMPIDKDIVLCFGDTRAEGLIAGATQAQVRRLNEEAWSQSKTIAGSSKQQLLSLVKGSLRAARKQARNRKVPI